MPLSAPVPRKHLHTRSVTFQGFDREDGMWDIEAHLTDAKTYPQDLYERGRLEPQQPIHDLWIRLTVDDQFMVRAVESTMDGTPTEECQGAKPPMQGLVGVNLGPGLRRAVDRVLGGTLGCTHLRELVVNMATVAYQLIPHGQRYRQGITALPTGPEVTTPPFHVGRCIAWDVDGPVVARVYPQFVGWEPLRRVDKPRREGSQPLT